MLNASCLYTCMTGCMCLLKFLTIAKSILTIATNITSGSEEKEDEEERMDDASAIKN
jgi:hypothetical protein